MSVISQPEAESHLEHTCTLQYDATGRVRLTRIICTIGPYSKIDVIEKLIDSGLDIARLNFSHGTHESHSETVKNIRIAVKNRCEKLGVACALTIALDTKGPEIRTGLLDSSLSAEIELRKGELIRLTICPEFADRGTAKIVWVDYANIVNVVKPGNRIHIDDGLISLMAEEVSGDEILCKIEIGGLLGSRKGVNLHCVPPDLPAISERDRADLKWAVAHEIDVIFASFVRNADTVRDIRAVLGENGKEISIIAKIDDLLGLEHLDSIIEASDGVLVSRALLSIEIAPEKVFIAQKSIMARCNREGKPVICTTQIIESMLKNPRAIRAEISDIANAILDGADAVLMAGGESAKGDYPLDCVLTLEKTCKQAEAAVWQRNFFTDLVRQVQSPLDVAHTVAISAVQASTKCDAAAIIVITTTGRSAQLISKYRPKCPIMAVTRWPKAARQCNLCRGILPVIYTGYYIVQVFT